MSMGNKKNKYKYWVHESVTLKTDKKESEKVPYSIEESWRKDKRPVPNLLWVNKDLYREYV